MSPDNITFNPANKKKDQSLSNFQTGIGVASQVALDMEQLISGTRVPLVDAIGSLHDSNEGVILVQEVLELLTKIMIFWTMLCLSGLEIQLVFLHLFNFAFRQQSEIWALQYPFPHNFKDSSS